MRNILVSFILLILFSFSGLYSNENRSTGYSIVEIITPSKVVYDDGIYRTVYSSFTLYNESGEKVLSSGDVFDFATKVKLQEGTYKILCKNEDGKIIEKSFVIDKENMVRVIYCQ